ncbi:hypothetical protein HYPSUDRAFT_669409 [Hypholoma sublateritium FD-334 SS-4]|uniref:Uncharacterized protein n=1 Tax=Hypholoma sublateritium (strain FD-334 SS-4) TaxID=945553 RepID=A0A0D2L5R9_HYPSF|nr:hypothetical protein HYPSUDRAFT_669409 [Hypholoma sublateritium FD-334 SS-4]
MTSEQELMRIVQTQKTKISDLEGKIKQLQAELQRDKGYIATLNSKCQTLEGKVQQYQTSASTGGGPGYFPGGFNPLPHQ